MGTVIVMTNEALAELIRVGNTNAVEEILQDNREYLCKMARRLSNNPDTIEDLVQEGSIALLDAVDSYDTTHGVRFLTYATPFIRKAMRDFMARMSLPMAMPTARYSQLQRVHYLVAKAQMEKGELSLERLLQLVCLEIGASEKVALGLLRDYYAVYRGAEADGQWEQSAPCFDDDPAKVYKQELLSECIGEAMEQLSSRERNLIRYHLGLDVPDGVSMTFQELAVLLNFNGHSAAEKAYQKAIKSLRRAIYTGKYGAYIQVKLYIAAAQRNSFVLREMSST